MSRKPSKTDVAIDRAIESATDEVFLAVHFPDGRLRREAIEYARGIYRGAWIVSLWIDRELPKPSDWICWALHAADEVLAAEQRRSPCASMAVPQ